jgi:ligand-binding sensor domain-containing protein
MTGVVVVRCRPRTITRIERCAAVLVLMATVCVGAFALDRDRSIAQFYYTFWSEKDGAPSEISALAQTKDGYLWIGSARGLFRFDGVNFEEYLPPPGVNLPSHSIFSLMATPEGGLWIAFEPNGLGFYKDGSLTVFTRPEELPDSPVHCFARDNDGRIWAGTETGLEFRQGDRWISVGREWNFTPEMTRSLFVDREGTLWVATVKQVVYLKRGAKRFELGGPVGTGVTTLAQAPNARVWLADDGTNEVRPVPAEGHNSTAPGPSIAANGVRELLFDRDGALWITRLDSGIVRIRNPGQLEARKYGPQDRELESFGAKGGFPAGSAYNLLEDREGNIWVGCSNGLIRFRHNQVVPVRLPQRYERLTLLAGQHGELWVGTIYDKPLLKISGENIVPEKGGNTVSSVLREANGDVWWGSRAGIWRQRDATFTYFHLAREAVPDWMWDLIPGSDNHGFWVKLGDVGLVRFHNGVWNLHDWPRGVPSVGGTFRYGPSASYRDPSGRFWFGYTSGQIYLLDQDHATYSIKITRPSTQRRMGSTWVESRSSAARTVTSGQGVSWGWSCSATAVSGKFNLSTVSRSALFRESSRLPMAVCG